MLENLASACWFSPALKQSIDALPGGSTTFVKRYERAGQTVDVSFQRLSLEALNTVVSFLRERQNKILRERTVQQIVDILDLAADRWLDPEYGPRRQATAQISAITGFSPEMVSHSIYLEQISSRGPHLIQALKNELGDPAFLDGFQPNDRLGGFSYAQGPGLIGAIFSSNIPALPHLEVMRAMLTKSACLGRVSAGEPIFLSLYAQTLQEIDPDLASCVAVIYWERDDYESEALFLNSIGYLVAYGGDQQIKRLLKAKPPSLEATWHGHGVGFTYISKDALTKTAAQEIANKVSYDFTVFDGHACLCPQVCFVETGGEVSPREFASICAKEMADWAIKLPPRNLNLSEASLKYRLREISLMRDSIDGELQVVAAPEDNSFLVIFGRLDEFEPSPLDRFFRIAPVEGLADVEKLISPVKEYLQCAALASGEATNRRLVLYRELASWGISRIVPPGIMGTPSMMWHHDGNSCLGKMVSWCDNELMLPEELLLER